jgi:hypothetical protein
MMSGLEAKLKATNNNDIRPTAQLLLSRSETHELQIVDSRINDSDIGTIIKLNTSMLKFET